MQLNPTAGGLPFTSGRSLYVLEAFLTSRISSIIMLLIFPATFSAVAKLHGKFRRSEVLTMQPFISFFLPGSV